MTEVEILNELVALWKERALRAEKKLENTKVILDALEDLIKAKISLAKFQDVLREMRR